MAKKIDGIKFIKTKEYAYCNIEYFSDELKSSIRAHLSEICHGTGKATTKIKKGLIGELLTHIIISEMFPEYRVISPYFNLEERSIKKGFDIVLVSKKANYELFVTEVKAGEVHKGKTSDETMNDLIGLAKNDLLSRLSDDNTSLWHNAINGALDRNDDYKDAIIEVLEDMGDKSVVGQVNNRDINVFLTGVLFASFSDRASEVNTKKKLKTIAKEGKFKSVFGLSIQKETFVKVYNFFKDEVK